MTISTGPFCALPGQGRGTTRSLGMAAPEPADDEPTGPDVTTRRLDTIAVTPKMASQGAPAAAAPQSVTAPSARGADWPWLQAAVQGAWRGSRWATTTPSTGDDGGWSDPPRVATRTPVPVTRSIATARAFTLRTLQKWGAESRGEDAAAVVTELMTNALRHALADLPADGPTMSAWPIRLGLADPGPFVICAVADPSAELPTPRRPAWQDEAGRGLLVVGYLSDHWGCCTAPDGRGKVVWAAFAAASRSL
jgi:anti-sigma regulatory factor (Ser/Thr protein kinase)